MHRLRPDKVHKMHRNSFPTVAPTTTVGRSSSSAAIGATVTLEIEASRNEICSPPRACAQPTHQRHLVINLSTADPQELGGNNREGRQKKRNPASRDANGILARVPAPSAASVKVSSDAHGHPKRLNSSL